MIPRHMLRMLQKIYLDNPAHIAGVGILGPKLFFVTGLVKFVTVVARLVCPDLLE